MFSLTNSNVCVYVRYLHPQGASTDALAKTKSSYEAFLGNPDNLAAVRVQLQTPGLTEEQKGVLAIMEKTFKCYITEDPEAKVSRTI